MKVKLYYAPINNMGDDLNRLLMQHFFKKQLADKARIDNFNIMGIGSCLGSCFYGHDKCLNPIRLEAKKISAAFHGIGHIWGTGFIEEYPYDKMKLIRNNIKFDIVRGELTRQGVSKVLRQELDVPLADGGLLAPYLIENKKIIKSDRIGIIPHYREKTHPAVRRLMDSVGERAVLIDVQDDSINVITQIAACDYIISSSLHGLIVADAFNVPNSRIKITDKLLGTGFKFDDYYSAFNMKKSPVFINDRDIELEELYYQPQVDYIQVKKKQDQLIQCMNGILESL